MLNFNRILLSLLVILLIVIAGEIGYYYYNTGMLALPRPQSTVATSAPAGNAYNLTIDENKDVCAIEFAKLLQLYMMEADNTFVDGDINVHLSAFFDEIQVIKDRTYVYYRKDLSSPETGKIYFSNSSITYLNAKGEKIKPADFKKDDPLSIKIVYKYKTNIFQVEVQKKK